MLERLYQQVSPFSTAPRWVIAYSGGVDSHVLLHALSMLAKQYTLPVLHCVHVNHGISPYADAWQQHCIEQAEKLGVSIETHSVQISSTANIEEQARLARYSVFENLLAEGDVLFTAHHQQDQVETTLYRLFRGAGLSGLSGMPQARQLGLGRLFRPLLSIPKQQIDDYAKTQGISFIVDESNEDNAFDRNYIRHKLIPVIKSRWPSFEKSVARMNAHALEASALLDELAAQDLGEAVEEFDLSSFENASILRTKNALRYWLDSHKIRYTTAQLEELMRQAFGASDDAQLQLHLDEVYIRRYKKKLYIRLTEQEDTFIEKQWHTLESINLGEGVKLSLEQPVDLTLVLKPRLGGEKISCAGKGFQSSVKQLLQEAGVPPWRRGLMPLVYHGDQLVSLGDLFYTDYGKQLLSGNKIVIAWC